MTVDRVFLLYEDPAGLQGVTAESASWGVSIRDLGALDLSAMPALDDDDAAGVIDALHFQAHTMLMNLNRLRALFPAAGIVILKDEEIPASARGLLFLMGVDAVFGSSASGMEILGAIQALQRRGLALKKSIQAANEEDAPHPINTRQASPAWHLCDDGWSLMTPSRQSVSLTRGERHILQTLFDQCPNIVERKDLLIAARQSEPVGRYVDVQISRLKRKVAEKGEMIPIRTVRDKGYAFIESPAQAA